MIMHTNFSNLLVVILATSLFAEATSAASDNEPIEELRRCARTAESVVRAACYETLGKRVLAQESGEMPVANDASAEMPALSKVPNSPAPASVEPQPVASRLSDDIGGENFKEKKTTEDKESARGHVRSCKQSVDGKWYFVFDSGQVWKQSSRGNYKFSNCDFDVTITKDFFSHEMQIDGGRKLRVRRQK